MRPLTWLYLAIAVVLGAVIAVATRLSDAPKGLGYVIYAVAAIVTLVGQIVQRQRLRDRSYRRPARFAVSPMGFHAESTHAHVANLPFLGATIGLVSRSVELPPWHNAVDEIYFFLLIAIFLASVLSMVYYSGLASLTLTPQGLRWGRWPFNGAVAWEELVPGGPQRPRPGHPLKLATRGGWRTLDTNTVVHPWLVTDAIRWYAEHPQDRAAIGSQAEHDRLVQALELA